MKKRKTDEARQEHSEECSKTAGNEDENARAIPE
jgi:hypothetical protein